MSTGAPAPMQTTPIPPCPTCGDTGCDRMSLIESLEDHLRARFRDADGKRARYKAFLEVLIDEVKRAQAVEGRGSEAGCRIALGLAEIALNQLEEKCRPQT